MSGPLPNPEPGFPKQGVFATTRWSVVLHAGSPDPDRRLRALEHLCATYWFPIYGHIRRRGHGPEDAKDFTQEFFCRLLEKEWLDGVEQNGHRFRSFLITILDRFLANQYDRATAAKRGGGLAVLSLDAQLAEQRYDLEPATSDRPESAFDRQWALAVMDQALTRLRQETDEADKSRQFNLLSPFLSREPATGDYARIARELGISPTTVGVSVHRLRHRYRELVREEVAETLTRPEDLEDELRHLLRVLRA